MSQPALAGFRCRRPAGRGVIMALSENGRFPASRAGRKPETVQRKRTNGLMSRGVAKGMGLRGCWRQWLATAWLIVAFAALALQAGAHTLPAAHTVHAERAVAASLDQGCDHSHAASGCARTISGDQDGSSGSGSGSQDDCCAQFCTITALLPESPRADPPSGGETRLGILVGRLGRTPEGILRPPRSSVAA